LSEILLPGSNKNSRSQDAILLLVSFVFCVKHHSAMCSFCFSLSFKRRGGASVLFRRQARSDKYAFGNNWNRELGTAREREREREHYCFLFLLSARALLCYYLILRFWHCEQ